MAGEPELHERQSTGIRLDPQVIENELEGEVTLRSGLRSALVHLADKIEERPGWPHVVKTQPDREQVACIPNHLR